MRFSTMAATQRGDAIRLRDGKERSWWWRALLYVFFVFVFVTGGSSQLRGWTDAMAELLALPILAYGLWRLAGLPPSRVRMLGLLAMTAVAFSPWLQLLPLGDYLWLLPPVRVELAKDLANVGVTGHATTWSLIPSGSLRAGLAMLPAIALFVAVLGENATTQRRLLILCVLLPIASLLLGFLQLGAPRDSLLNPYPQWAPAMGGTFANPNHQGTSMLVGLGICLAFALDTFGGQAEIGQPARMRNPWPAVIAGSTLLLGLPLTNSRAAVAIGVLLLMAAPLGMAATSLRRGGQMKRGIVALLVVATLGALGLSAAMGWMKIDELEELRGILRRSTLLAGVQHFPLGSGIGSFVPIFQQLLPESLLLPKFANAAHNDLVQVWLEGGVIGCVVGALVMFTLTFSALVHFLSGAGNRRLVWSAILGLFVFVAHAAADYALRTPSLMAVAALLASVLIAQSSQKQE